MSSKMVLDALGYQPAKGMSFGDPVQDLAGLSAVTSLLLQDKQIRLVENSGTLYRYDAESMLVASAVKVIRPAHLTSAQPGRWILQSTVDHGLLENLLDDVHTQYVHKDNARLIVAQHTFNPATSSAAFILGANAVGQKVVGLNADQLDGIDSASFVQTGSATTITAKHTFNPAATDVPFVLGASAQGQKVIGLNADQLDGIDSTEFVQKTSATTITAVHTINPVATSAPIILGANAQGQKVIGLNADQLDGLDSSAFVQKGTIAMITVSHTFNPAVVGPPLVLGANAIGQKVIGLNADQLDGLDSADFVTELELAAQKGAANGIATLDSSSKVNAAQLRALANGMPAYLENVSGVLISTNAIGVNFSIVSGATRNVYLNNMGDIASNTMGFILPRNAMLLSVVVALSANTGANTNASFQLRKNDVVTAIGTYPLAAATNRRIFTGLNLQLNAGDELQSYIAASQNVANPTMFLEIAWRD